MIARPLRIAAPLPTTAQRTIGARRRSTGVGRKDPRLPVDREVNGTPPPLRVKPRRTGVYSVIAHSPENILRHRPPGPGGEREPRTTGGAAVRTLLGRNFGLR